MSEDQDKSNRTEEPTEKKIADAQRKGSVPYSQGTVSLSGFVGIAIVLQFMIADSSKNAANLIYSSLMYSGSGRVTTAADMKAYLLALIIESMNIIAPIVIVLSFASIIGSLAQGKPVIALERTKPKLERLSLVSGFKRLFGAQGLFVLVKSCVTLFLIFAIAAFILGPGRTSSSPYMLLANESMISELVRILALLSMLIASVYLLPATVDFIWARRSWRNGIKMTRNEVKDEHKDSEGDPLYRSFRRSKALARARERTISAVSGSTLLITNPTHFAIALRYIPDESAAPILLAKGQDHIALRMRSAAAEHNIPIVENRMLARAMFRSVEVNQIIPSCFYQAVAEILVLLQKRRLKHELYEPCRMDKFSRF